MSQFRVHDKRPDPWLRVDLAAFRLIVRELDASSLAAYVGLISHANKSGQAWMMLTTLRESTGLSVSTLKTKLSDLELIGLIEIDETYDSEGKGSNLYSLLETPVAVPANWRSQPRRRRNRFRYSRQHGQVVWIPIGHPVEPESGSTDSQNLAILPPESGSTTAKIWPQTRLRELTPENQSSQNEQMRPADVEQLTRVELEQLNTPAARLELYARHPKSFIRIPEIDPEDLRADPALWARYIELQEAAS